MQLLPTQRLGLHCVAECTKGAPRSAQPKDPARNYDCPNTDTSGDSRSGCPTVPPHSHLAKLSFRMLSQRGTRNLTAGERHWDAATDSPYIHMHECTTRALHSSSICMPAAGPTPPQGPKIRTHTPHTRQATGSGGRPPLDTYAHLASTRTHQHTRKHLREVPTRRPSFSLIENRKHQPNSTHAQRLSHIIILLVHTRDMYGTRRIPTQLDLTGAPPHKQRQRRWKREVEQGMEARRNSQAARVPLSAFLVLPTLMQGTKQ